MSHNGPTDVHPENIFLVTIGNLLETIRPLVDQCDRFNDLPNIPWNLREQMRTIEGHLDKVDWQLCLEFVDKMRTEDSAAFVAKYWPLDKP